MENLSLNDDSYLLVAAIDFGTTFSGYAFSFKHSKENQGSDMAIIMNKNWGAEQGHLSYKTPTCLLLDARGETLEFGYGAEKTYAEGEADGLRLFRHFKMALFKKQGDQKLSKDVKIQAADGSWHRGLDVFSKALRFLKNHLLEAVKLAHGKNFDPFLIRWVLTVPAIWNDEAKLFMREAAFEAGLISEVASRKLLIALEPEAASIECRSVEIGDFKRSGMSLDSFKKLTQSVGARYLVVDAGGGTVDITGHEILTPHHVKEVIPPSGGDWGGTMVDKNFEKLLSDILTKEFVDQFRKENPCGWLQTVMNFQTVKLSAKLSSKEPIKIPVPYPMNESYMEIKGGSLGKAVQNQKVRKVKFGNGFLVVDPEEVENMFNPVVQQTAKHVKALLESTAMKHCEFIFLVGGFGSSSILHDALQNAVGKRPVVAPPDAQIAVLKGAVRFGMNADVIRNRIARRTYGTSCVMRAIKPAYRKEHIFERDGKKCARNVFELLLDKGESIEVNSVRKFKRAPVSKEQTTLWIKIVASDKPAKDIVHTDDAGVENVGEITVPSPDVTKTLQERTVEYEVTFGATEILVQARDPISGKTSEAIVNFLAQ